MKLTRSLISVATLLGAISGAFAQNLENPNDEGFTTSLQQFNTIGSYAAYEANVTSLFDMNILNRSWENYANDPYFSTPFVIGPTDPSVFAAEYQWGLEKMNFPHAWQKSSGHAYIGVLEPGYPGETNKTNPNANVHEDLIKNYRKQFSPGVPIIASGSVNPSYWTAREEQNTHATHVFGIIAAEANNDKGIAGACPNCSVALYAFTNNIITSGYRSGYPNAINYGISSGMQILNWSGGDKNTAPCDINSKDDICKALIFAKKRNVLLIQSAGNYGLNEPDFPSNSSDDYWVLPVGGVEIKHGGQLGSWFYSPSSQSSKTGFGGVMAPAKSIVSSIPKGYENFPTSPFAKCGDTEGTDESAIRLYKKTGYGDGYGSCTGTSMAAPHVAALAGLIWSVNPLLPADTVRSIIRQSGSSAHQPTQATGYGMPDAIQAVNAAIATNPSRLTPLFSFYSSTRVDSFYTTIPQMASAALAGTLMPRELSAYDNPSTIVSDKQYEPFYGEMVSEYSSFPGFDDFVIGPAVDHPLSPKAEVYIFTTHENPKNPAIPLVPLYRMSWLCGDSTPTPSACYKFPAHSDTAYTADPINGVKFFEQLGYKLDGIEGYIYPKTMPQPAGTVRLMRKYNPVRDDHAIFPESQLTAMYYLGYNQDTGSDWIGYVYPNYGYKPTVQ